MIQSPYMEIHYQKHRQRKNRAKDFWMQVAADFNAGIPATEIANRYRNPMTGQNYSRTHIYWILKKVKQL